jgi:hypothetical protein
MTDPDPLDFAVNLTSVRDRLSTLAYFNSVSDLQEATLNIENLTGIPPLAFVSVASETADPNKLIGGLSQRVTVSISVLFCVAAEAADRRPKDALDETRRAVIRILLGWTPVGAEKALEYQRFLLRASRDGLIWGEVLMRTLYYLRLAT